MTSINDIAKSSQQAEVADLFYNTCVRTRGSHFQEPYSFPHARRSAAENKGNGLQYCAFSVCLLQARVFYQIRPVPVAYQNPVAFYLILSAVKNQLAHTTALWALAGFLTPFPCQAQSSCCVQPELASGFCTLISKLLTAQYSSLHHSKRLQLSPFYKNCERCT